MIKSEVFDLIISELRAAEEKHPSWPADVIHAVGILAEEAGEAMKEAIDVTYKGKSTDDLKKELAQTGAMAIRALINLE